MSTELAISDVERLRQWIGPASSATAWIYNALGNIESVLVERLRALPREQAVGGMPVPEFSCDDDGALTVEWYRSSTAVLSVACDDGAEFHFAAATGPGITSSGCWQLGEQPPQSFYDAYRAISALSQSSEQVVEHKYPEPWRLSLPKITPEILEQWDGAIALIEHTDEGPEWDVNAVDFGRMLQETAWPGSCDRAVAALAASREPVCGYQSFRNHTCVRPEGHAGEHSSSVEVGMGHTWGTDPDDLPLSIHRGSAGRWIAWLTIL